MWNEVSGGIHPTYDGAAIRHYFPDSGSGNKRKMFLHLFLRKGGEINVLYGASRGEYFLFQFPVLLCFSIRLQFSDIRTQSGFRQDRGLHFQSIRLPKYAVRRRWYILPNAFVR